MSGLVLITIVLLVIFLLNSFLKLRAQKGKNTSLRVIKLFIAGYGLLLIIAATFLYLLPKETNANKEVTQEQKDRAILASESLYSAASKGQQMDQLDGVLNNGSWRYVYHDQELSVTFEEKNEVIFTFVERKDVNDSKIEITSYTTETIYQKVDFTEEHRAPQVELTANVLKITPPEKMNLKLAKLNKEFPINQFSKKNQPHLRPDYVLGNQIIYIRVPKNMKINGPVQFVEK